MAEQVISIRPADLSFIEGSLASLNSNLGVVNENVQAVGGHVMTLQEKQETLEDELRRLAQAFDDYVGEYRRKTELQAAKTDIISVRQELEHKFGYYAEIRRMGTGIVQAVDSKLVTSDTLQYATEEAMIKAPGYWLAPTMVCMAAWLRNDQDTALRAVKEAIRRDDYKTSLFFTLMCRRVKRPEAVLKWIERYFMHQNPRDLDREFILILESVSTGVFPPASRELMIKYVKEWIKELSQTDDYINVQKANWNAFFVGKKESEEQSQYPIMKEFATNWTQLEHSLQMAKANRPIYAHFNAIVASGSHHGTRFEKQLDALLNSLVTNFDDEELPLKKRERECELIIEKQGDKDAALAVLAAEAKIYEEKVDLLQMLSNAAFNPEKSGASTATQALAVSLSQDWILEGYNTFTAGYRAGTPMYVDFDIDGFKEQTADGSDEKELAYKQSTFYEQQKDELMAAATFPWSQAMIPIVLIAVGVIALIAMRIYGLAGILVGAFWLFRIWKQNEDYKSNIDAQVEERKKKAAEVLRGLLAEVVDYRHEVTKEDNESETVLQFMGSINSESFMSLSQGAARSILK